MGPYVITRVLTRRRRGRFNSRERRWYEDGAERMLHCWPWRWKMGPWRATSAAQEVGKGKKQILPEGLRRDYGSVNRFSLRAWGGTMALDYDLALAQWNPFQTSGFQKWKKINVCSFKPPSLQPQKLSVSISSHLDCSGLFFSCLFPVYSQQPDRNISQITWFLGSKPFT